MYEFVCVWVSVGVCVCVVCLPALGFLAKSINHPPTPRNGFTPVVNSRTG